MPNWYRRIEPVNPIPRELPQPVPQTKKKPRRRNVLPEAAEPASEPGKGENVDIKA